MQEDNTNTEAVQNWVDITDGTYLYIPKVFTKLEGNALLKGLLEEIDWQQKAVKMYGKETASPRLMARYGDVDKTYKFGGEEHTPMDWTETLKTIKAKVEEVTGLSFNSVLLNNFRDGNDSTYWYSDAESELGKNPAVVYVSFGVTRKFQLSHREIKEKRELNLTHGSVLVTKGELQHFWVHQTPKSKKNMKECVSLTFRTVVE